MGALKQRSAKALVTLIAGGVPLALFAGGAMADVIHNAAISGNGVDQSLDATPTQVAAAVSGGNGASGANAAANAVGPQSATGGDGTATVDPGGDIQLNDGSDVTGTGGDAANGNTQSNRQRLRVGSTGGAADAWNDLHAAVTQSNTGGARTTQDGGGNTVGNVLNDQALFFFPFPFGGNDVVHNFAGASNEVAQSLTVTPTQVAASVSGGNIAEGSNTAANTADPQTATGGAGTATVGDGGTGAAQLSDSAVTGTGGGATNTGPQTNDQGGTVSSGSGAATGSNSGQLTIGQSNGGGATSSQTGGDNTVGNVENTSTTPLIP